MPDLNANDIDAASKIIAGTARSMGVDVEEMADGRNGKRYRAAYEKIDREQDYDPRRGGRAGQETATRQVRRDRRGAHPHSASTSATPRSSCAARSPAARARQGRHGRRLRQGRRRASAEAAEPTTSAPRTSPSEIEEGWTDFDVVDRDARHDADGRQARPRARPAGQDAEPEGRHRHRRRRARPSTRPRPARSSTAPTARRIVHLLDRQGQLRRAGAARELRRA